jgi:hypothetical protein
MFPEKKVKYFLKILKKSIKRHKNQTSATRNFEKFLQKLCRIIILSDHNQNPLKMIQFTQVHVLKCYTGCYTDKKKPLTNYLIIKGLGFNFSGPTWNRTKHLLIMSQLL